MTNPITPFHATEADCQLIKGIAEGVLDEDQPTMVILIGEDQHIYLHRAEVGTIAMERNLCNIQDPEELVRFLTGLTSNIYQGWPEVHKLYEEHATTALGIALLDGSLDRDGGHRNIEVCGDSANPKTITLWLDTDPMKSETEEALRICGQIGIPYHTYTQTIIPDQLHWIAGLTEMPVIAASLSEEEGFLLEICDPDPIELMRLERTRHG
ncbi:MAG: hypothetical protein CL472_00845 [Acidobacteria bacterium]|nr:hypothetical protein [Acidobacteriota bacterium]